MLYIPSSEAIQMIVVAEEVLVSKVLHFVMILAGAVFATPAKSTWHDVTLFQKVVLKSSAGYHGVVGAKFHKIKIGTGNNNIMMMITGGVRGHRQVCWVLTNRYCKNSKRGVNDSRVIMEAQMVIKGSKGPDRNIKEICDPIQKQKK